LEPVKASDMKYTGNCCVVLSFLLLLLSHPKIPFWKVNHFFKRNSKFTKDFVYLNLK
jgi:hypothetical protein